MNGRPCVVVGVHDGFYGSGTGAGYANRGFLTTLIRLLAPGVRLVVAPIYLAADSPEYQAAWHDESMRLCRAVDATILPIDNGTGGQVRFGGAAAFARAAESTAAALTAQVLPTSGPLAVVLFDVPFLGVASHLDRITAERVVVVPRSTGLLHDPANTDRIDFERAGFDALVAAGGRVAAISAYMRAHLSQDYAVADAAIVDLPDGLTADEWRYEPPGQPVLSAAAQAGFLLAYGRGQPYKGWDDLVDALALLRAAGVALPHAVLAVVTDQATITPYQAELAARICELNLDATLMTRFDPSIRALLRHPALRAVVVPSRVEPFGRVPLEAYAARAAPVVATTAGGLAEQVVNGVTGFSASPADPASLAAALGRAIGQSDDQRREMAEQGLSLARSRFDHGKSVAAFLDRVAPWAGNA